jgi:hypothetical protein
MISDPIDFSPRHPRHETTGTARLRVEVRQGDSAAAETVDAQLVDLSRNGFQLLTAVSLTLGEMATAHLSDEQSGLSLELEGIARWQRPTDDGTGWFVGCQCEQEIDWAIMGELFLNDVLVMD